MAAKPKLNIRARAPAAAVVAGLLLATTCLLLAATVANASRPLKVSLSSSSASEGDGVQHGVESPPQPPEVGYIQTVVVGADGAGHRLMSVDMLAGIKNSGPSPGDGH